MTLTDEELEEALRAGRIGYEGYREFSNGVSLVSGAPIPRFEELDPRIQNAWAFAANVVAIHTAGILVERALAKHQARFDSFSKPTR